MKLVGSLKDKVSTAGTMEEKRDLIAQAGMELSDDELENVAGGGIIFFKKTEVKPKKLKN